MKFKSKKTVFVLLFLFLFSSLSFCVSAADNGDNRKFVSVSDLGVHSEHPENSMPAVRDAVLAKADCVRISVKMTADKHIILSEDADLSRMCGGEKTPISELKWDDIKNLKLRRGSGGHEETTDETIPELNAILSAYGGKTTFIIDMQWKNRNEVYEAVKNAGCAESCIFVCREDFKKVNEWKSSLPTAVKYMVYKKTNIVFSAVNLAKAISDDPDGYLWLASSNPYGVIFGSSVTKYFPNTGGVMVSCSDKSQCGKRDDTRDNWENLVACGYNMICTDNLSGLKQYTAQSDAARDKLRDTVNYYSNSFKLPDFRGAAFSDYKFKYNNALNEALRLANKDFSGASECENAEYALSLSARNINENYNALSEGSAGFTITPGRIIVCVIAAAAFIAAELFFHKHRGKRKSRNA